jgi:hypothetical protein
MFGSSNSDKPQPKGMEIMLRSMGMGPILDMGLQLANDGTLAKIIAFAESADEILKTLREVKIELEKRNAGNMAGDNGTIAGSANLESCPHCGAGYDPHSIYAPSTGLVLRLSENGSGNGHVHGGGDASLVAARPATDGMSAGGVREDQGLGGEA